MTAPNMATITESLERSLQNCSLNNHQRSSRSLNEGASEEEEEGIGRSDDNNLQNGDTALELNSHVSLPYHWEQCLDLKVSGLLSLFQFLGLSLWNGNGKDNTAICLDCSPFRVADIINEKP